ncbi:protein transport protein Sec16A isoform X3 [Plodia interpunctella]|uniref:protein transport protein Sec16A isoform X3 n=1 Tax=Plodia interpunctella TaxID=58824 RepID=UPI00236833F4|nr:protein transport protein Sec16A isoform X3 [Plodia interpunctella]
MSWMKRPKGGAPPLADQQLAAPQLYGNQPSAYPNFPSGTGGNNPPPPQQYWQAPPQQQPQYNQQYGQVYQQPADYGANANQYYQQQAPPQQYNQNYPNQTYNPQQGYQQNFYQNQGVQQQNYVPNKSNDGWEDNWNWGWEDQSKAQKAQGAAPQPVPQPPQPAYNNANVIEESFASTDSWNWAMEEKKEVKDHPLGANQGVIPQAVRNVEPSQDNNLVIEANQHNSNLAATEEVRTLNDTEIIKERLPNLALGKRFHIDNLTPQWSIESQMSQDSSDGPQTQSEGTFRSEMQSRNSDKSNCSQHSLDEPYPQNPEWPQQSLDEPGLENNTSSIHQHEIHNELANSMQEMSITNSENPAPDASLARETHVVNSQEKPLLLPPVSSVPPSLPTTHGSQPTQLPPSSQPPTSLPPAPTSASIPPPTSAAMPPPTNFPPPSLQSTNPFKNAGPFSHKNAGKVAGSNPTSSQQFPPPTSSSSLTSPGVVNKVSQHSRAPQGFSANLETTPDNSERPDHPQVMPFKPMQVAQQVPENLEVAPRSDRNEYLQTAHLSSGDYGENTDFSRNVPPPGLRRMVVGQQESEYNQNMNMSGDEPPPGLARMVPGQQNEEENIYNQPNDNYLDRHIDGQPTESGSRPYRQADGQQTPDNYTQPARGDRRPIGLDRMVPGEPSNDEYSQYQAPNYSSNEQRVVTGVDRDYPVQTDAGPTDVREQNVDGSDYSIQPSRNDLPDFPTPEEQQREVTMEGENLQDLSIVSSTEMSYSREHTLEGADMNTTDLPTDRKTDSDLDRPVTSSRRQSLNHVNTSGDDSERDRMFKNSPRRDKHRGSRDRDKEGRYSRGDRKFEREPERRSGRDRDHSPDARRPRRSARSRRYDTEDTDYYSDREREKRRYREGSYTSKPPRPDDKERRYDDRRRYNTIERERRYRDIDPARKYGNLRRDRDDEERRRVVTFSGEAKTNCGRREDELGSPSRAESRDPRDDRERRRGDPYRERRSRHSRPYYDSHGYGGSYSDPYQLQRAQYEYYEHLRHTDPAAYMQVYKQIMAGQRPPDFSSKVAGFMALREFQPEERGSVHSGRSSANDLKGHDTLYAYRSTGGAGSMIGAGNASMRTDFSDRDLNTDASLNLQLEESTVRSERMTPFKYSTAHIKGSISSRNVVVVRPSYPVDGRAATVHVLALSAALRRDPRRAELAAYPGVLLKGVTHKKSVIEYCMAKARSAYNDDRRDRIGYILLWELLALLLRQNGVVVGADIAELLMKNKREHEFHSDARAAHAHHAGSRRESPLSGSADEPLGELDGVEQPEDRPAVDEATALARLRELLTCGNRQEAIEWAMSSQLWGHALQLAAHCERRTRLAVHARFVATLPPADPLHTLYKTQHAKLPPVATCAVDGADGVDWRAHAAIVLGSADSSAEHAARARSTLSALGATLAARALPHSAQLCFVAAGAEPQPHPLQPLLPVPVTTVPRLALLLADHKAATLDQFATNEAIFATEIYEYALSLNRDYVIDSMQTYKLLLAIRLCDVGEYERALAYVESAARNAVREPHRYCARLLRALAELADRLKYHDPALLEETEAALDADNAPPSPQRQQWLRDVRRVAGCASEEPAAPQHAYDQLQCGWGEQPLQPQQQQQQPYQPVPTYEAHPAPVPAEETPDYAAQYYQQQPPPPPPQLNNEAVQAAAPPAPPDPGYADPAPQDYWQPLPDPHYYNDTTPNSNGDNVDANAPRPMITMPGGNGAARFNNLDDDRPPSADQSERESEPPRTAASKGREDGGKRSGWLGGLLGKLALRAPQQMILPDDSDPTIVWDEQNKRWRNKDGDDDVSGPPPPPPKITPPALALQRSSSPPLQAPAGAAAPPVTNIFKMQKGRHIKKSYVDVLNPGGAARAAPDAAPPPPPPAPPVSYFVPHQSGIFDPSQVPSDDYHNSGI